MSIRARIAPAVVLAFVLGIATMTLPASAGASCSNEEVRAEQSSERLPDCRAFELVTPEIKGDNSSIGDAGGIPYGFPDGNHVYYYSILPMPGGQNGGPMNNLSTRTPSGWVNAPLAPPSGNGEAIGLFSNIGGASSLTFETAFTGDFSAAFVNTPFDTDPEDQDGAIDAYRMNLSTGESTLASRPDTGPMLKSYESEYTPGSFIVDVSEDGSHVFFQTVGEPPVAPGTPTGPNLGNMLYDRTDGHTYAVGVLSDGTTPSECSVELGDGSGTFLGQGRLSYGAMSPDGSNVVFTTHTSQRPGGECPSPAVYLRKDNKTTIQLTGEAYDGRSADGSKVFTSNGLAVSVGANLEEGIYEYDVASGQTTVVSPKGWFVASSSDGSRVYYLIGEGLPNAGLYLWDKGNVRLVVGAEGFASAARFEHLVISRPDWAVVTPDGSKLLFIDRADLTGHNVTSPLCAEHYERFGIPVIESEAFSANCGEAYVYDANTDTITCVSCNPNGVPPIGVTHLTSVEQKDTLLPPYSEGEISPDGSRVFFETEDALVPQDTNGVMDVYEWEDGRVYLISSGQGTFGSAFSGASADGHDVFVITTDRLAPQDIENSIQIYDARIDGGFPYRPFIPGCDSGQCQGPQTPAPAFGAPASATFVGLGNPAVLAAPVVKAKPKAKPKPKVKQKKRHKLERNRGKRRKPGRSAHRASRAGISNGKGGK